MNCIKVNSEIIKDLIDRKSLALQIKLKRGTNIKNHFFISSEKDSSINSSISLELYNAKVSWIDPYKKHISFVFDKKNCLTLLNMLRYINENLTIFFNKQQIEPINVSPFFFEKGDFFYIRCFLPNYKKDKKTIYHIKSKYSDSHSHVESFVIPNVGYIYNSVIIDIRNIWVDNLKAGFNLELKETKNENI